MKEIVCCHERCVARCENKSEIGIAQNIVSSSGSLCSVCRDVVSTKVFYILRTKNIKDASFARLILLSKWIDYERD